MVKFAAHGDAVAQELVQRAASELRSLTTAVAQQLTGPLPVVLGGGLAPTIVGETLRGLLAESGLTDVTALDQEPVLGAPVLARAIWG